MRILISACLLGLPCRYDGQSRLHPDAAALAGLHELVPVCPEQLGGLPTPRPPAERVGTRVVAQDGRDVTAQYARGAEAAADLARLLGCSCAVLKERSPSCGWGAVYDGTFSHTLTPGGGVTAERLARDGLRILGESRAHLLLRVLETPRLTLREMTPEDLPALCRILQDPEVMYAYGHAFSDQEARDWLSRQMDRCRRDGHGLWAMVERAGGELVGQCGLTWQAGLDGGPVLEVGYLLRRDVWHRGYATEAARACVHYAFDTLGAGEVWAMIREDNLPSQRVARRCGMEVRGSLAAHSPYTDMPHLAFSVRRDTVPG